MPGGGGLSGGWAKSLKDRASAGGPPPQILPGQVTHAGTRGSMQGGGGRFGGEWAQSLMGRSSGGVAASTSMAGSADGAPSRSLRVWEAVAAGQPSTAGSNLGSTSAEGALRSSIRRLYEERNLKITEDTQPAFTNSDLVDPPTKLGAGVFNTVYAVKLEDSEGKSFDGVFKPLRRKEDGWVAAATGIPADDPQIAMRNLATHSYAKKLGIDVIPDTHLAVFSTGLQSTKLGLIMERADGTQAIKADPNLFRRADVCAEVTKLQLLDHLTGQGDRHAGNYFIDAKSGHSAKVTGIDNDQCFGAKVINPNSIRYAADSAHNGFKGTSLPPVVDCEMASMVGALRRSDIRHMLGDKLSEPEVQAAIARLGGVTRHIAKLSEHGRIISPSQWGNSAVQNLLTAKNSYVGRERERALAEQAKIQARAAAQRQQSNAGP